MLSDVMWCAVMQQDPSRVKKILPFTGELDLTADTGVVEDTVDEMIQRLDMAMQVRSLARSLHSLNRPVVFIRACGCVWCWWDWFWRLLWVCRCW